MLRWESDSPRPHHFAKASQCTHMVTKIAAQLDTVCLRPSANFCSRHLGSYYLAFRDLQSLFSTLSVITLRDSGARPPASAIFCTSGSFFHSSDPNLKFVRLF